MLGDLMVAVGRGEDAARYFQQSHDIATRLATAEPDRADYQRDLSISYERLGDLMERADDLETAIDLYERSLPLAQALADNQQTQPGLQQDLLITLSRLAELYDDARQSEKSAQYRAWAQRQARRIEGLAAPGEAESVPMTSAGEP